MIQSINSMQLHSFLQCMHSLKLVNIFQLFPKGKKLESQYQALNHAKSRIAILANMVRKAYIPIEDQFTFFDAKDLSMVLNSFYGYFGITENNNKTSRINADIKPNSAWPSINQFCHYIVSSRDLIKYVANSPSVNIKRQYNSKISVNTIQQICATFMIIHSHYSNHETLVSRKKAKEILTSVFGYY